MAQRQKMVQYVPDRLSGLNAQERINSSDLIIISNRFSRIQTKISYSCEFVDILGFRKIKLAKEATKIQDLQCQRFFLFP